MLLNYQINTKNGDSNGNSNGNTSVIPLPRCRVFAKTLPVLEWDEKLEIEVVVGYDSKLYMDLYPPTDFDLFYSFQPQLCFFNYKIIGDNPGFRKWRPMMKCVGRQEPGILAEIFTLPVTFGKEQILFESYDNFVNFTERTMPIIYDGKSNPFVRPRNNRVLNKKAIRFSVGLVYNPGKVPIKDYKQGKGLQYIRLANFNIIATEYFDIETRQLFPVVIFGNTIT